MRFVDLFAGLGGFHLALRKLGHTCVFACEIDEALRDVYEKNFGMRPAKDIRKVKVEAIPSHDILCAGFPCQPFSKAGEQEGLEYPELGDLYKEILKVIQHHHPRYLILENVPNLEKHRNGQTWREIEYLLHREGYDVNVRKLSPHQFGIPQVRERIYVVGKTTSLNGFKWPEFAPRGTHIAIESVLDQQPAERVPIPAQVRRCLLVWQEFLDLVPRGEKIIHPLWSMEFGATYPYENATPYSLSTDDLRGYRGSYGRPLSDVVDREELFKLLPSHARREGNRFPEWKINFIRKNRAFYERHKAWLDQWTPKINQFPSSFQKLEWNCQEAEPIREVRDLWKYVIQIRPSGVRVKRPTTAPSLIAMTATQVPIIAWEGRYVTPAECKRLQSMDTLEHLPQKSTKAFWALGNAVNVEVARLVSEALLNSDAEYVGLAHAEAGGSPCPAGLSKRDVTY